MILVCGATGLLGREICNKLEKENIQFIGSYFSNEVLKKNYFKFDIDTLDKIIEKYKPNIIINCIVNRFVDDCEKNWNKIKDININIPKKLLSYNIKLIQISTDYIFNGNKSPYYPENLGNPLQNYGISKYLAELEIINNYNNYLIIRVPVLFTDNYKNLNESSVTDIGKKLFDLDYKELLEDNISIRRPIYIPLFVNFIYDAILNNYNGIYHFYNPIDKLTKYEILIKISKILNLEYSHIKPSYKIDNRPLDTELIDTKYKINKYYDNYNIDNLLYKCFNKFYHSRDLKNCFLLIDLDGTLIDSENLHFECYNEITGITNEDFYIKNQYNNLKFSDEIRNLKKKVLKEKIKTFELKLIDGAYDFINYINKNNINYCIVTNTDKETIQLFKNKLPILNTIKNWICKDDYFEKKPSNECYKKAIDLYHKNNEIIIGIENTIAGYLSLKSLTDIIYIKTNYNKQLFNNYDVYLFSNYNSLYKN